MKRKPHPTTNAQYQIVVRSTFTALEFRQVTFPDITFNAHYVVMRNESDVMSNAPSMKDADLMEKASSYLGDAPDVQKTRRRALAQLNRSLAATHKSIDEDSDQEDDEINADDLVIPTHDEDDDDLTEELLLRATAQMRSQDLTGASRGRVPGAVDQRAGARGHEHRHVLLPRIRRPARAPS